MQIMKGTEAGFFENVFSRLMLRMERTVNDAHPEGHFYYGPNSSEASALFAYVLMCAILPRLMTWWKPGLLSSLHL